MAQKLKNDNVTLEFSDDDLLLIYRAVRAYNERPHNDGEWNDDDEPDEDEEQEVQRLLQNIEQHAPRTVTTVKKELLREKYSTYRNNVDYRVHGVVESAFRILKRVSIEYFDIDAAKTVKREIDVHYMNSKYIIAYCHLRKDMRKFRASRVVTAKMTNKQYKVPKSFNKKDYL